MAEHQWVTEVKMPYLWEELVSNLQFVSHKKEIWNGSHKLILSGRNRSPWSMVKNHLQPNWNDPPTMGHKWEKNTR